MLVRQAPISPCGAAAVSAFRGALNPGRGDVLIHFGDGDDDGGGIKVEYLSVALFAVAQVIFAGERVLEENVFAESLESLDAITMFCWTMWVQFFLYFPLLPSQRLAALGGLRPGQIAPVERDGVLCTFGVTATTPRGLDLPHCSAAGNAALFFAYVLVDGSCYCFGLYVIKVYSANAMVLAGSVALPLQQLVFCLPFLVGRRYAETLFGTDVLALALVLGGFLAYHRLAPENSQRRG